MASILLLEDDKALHKGIKLALEKDGHSIHSAYSFFEGVETYMKQDIDLFLLDVNLPDGDGRAFCQKIRETSVKPIIFLTANDTEQDVIDGFQMGCDDYLAKPFSVEILRQRVLAVLRRAGNTDLRLFRYGDLEVNFNKMSVRKNDADIKLTATEYKFLELLIQNKGRVLTRTMLLEQIWDANGSFVDENTLSVHVRRLRQKLEDDPKNPRYIVTVFGIGYTFGE
jgi:DNA-binding response OmpR family regulator